MALIGAGEPGEPGSDSSSPEAVLGRGLRRSAATANGHRQDGSGYSGESSDEGGSDASDREQQQAVSAGGAASSGDEDSDDAAADDADAAVARMMEAAAGGRPLDAGAQLALPAAVVKPAVMESSEDDGDHMQQPLSAAGDVWTFFQSLLVHVSSSFGIASIAMQPLASAELVWWPRLCSTDDSLMPCLLRQDHLTWAVNATHHRIWGFKFTLSRLLYLLSYAASWRPWSGSLTLL